MVSTAVRRRVIEPYQITRQKAARAGVCLSGLCSADFYAGISQLQSERTSMDNQSESTS